MDNYQALNNIGLQLESVQRSLSVTSPAAGEGFSDIFEGLERISAEMSVTDPSGENKFLANSHPANRLSFEAVGKDTVDNVSDTNSVNNDLTVVRYLDGSAKINFQGGASHSVRGGLGGPVNALVEAYGYRISKIVDEV